MRPYENLKRAIGKVSEVEHYVCVVIGMHRKFNGGSRCDIGQENDKAPTLAVDLA